MMNWTTKLRMPRKEVSRVPAGRAIKAATLALLSRENLPSCHDHIIKNQQTQDFIFVSMSRPYHVAGRSTYTLSGDVSRPRGSCRP
jgi:hypothetical protein